MTFDDIRIEATGSGKAYRLPPRTGRGVRIAGGVLCGFGLLMTIFMALWMREPISIAIQFISGSRGGQSSGGSQAFGIASLVFGLLGLPVLLAGLAILIAGVGFLSGRSRNDIVVDDRYVRSIERVGLLRWSFKRRRSSLHSLWIGPARNDDSQQTRETLDHQIPAIALQGDRKIPLVLGMFYPAPLLADLAQAIGEDLDLVVEKRTPGARPDEGDERTDVVEQPRGSTATIERREDELTIVFPPAGVRKGSRGMFGFAIIWLAFITFFSAFWIPAWLSSPGWDKLVALFVLPFWAVGIAMMVAAVNMGRRRTIIDVVGQTLLISRASIFGVRQETIDAADIREIRVGPSGVEINDRPIYQLQIIRKGEAGKVGLLGERPDRELDWVVYELRRAMKI